jgi:cell division protein FtsQ
MSQERFERSRRAARWRRIRHILFGLFVVAVLGSLVWLVWFSDVLNVRRVEVDGLKTMSAADLRTQAAVPIGGPLARVDLGAIETRIASMPRVDSVEASRRWPHVVSIHVRERVPVAWVHIDGQTRLVDRHGVDFRTVRTGPSNLIELRIDATDPDIRVKAFEAATRVIVFLRRDGRDVFNVARYVSAETQDSVHLKLSPDRTVVWGSAENGAKKLAVLRALLKVKAARYDVSAPEVPTTKNWLLCTRLARRVAAIRRWVRPTFKSAAG